jgi:hypothetical protein
MKKLSKISVIVLAALVPVLGYTQPTPPPPNGNGGNQTGTNPDSVPFDGNMNVLFALVAIVFAIVVIRHMQKRQLMFVK